MNQTAITKKAYARTFCSSLVLVSFMIAPTLAVADEGGLSMWLPGQFGSLAATPQQPGWSFADIYYHTSLSAGGDVAAARELTIGAFTRTATVSLHADLNARADLDFVYSSYVFACPMKRLALTAAGDSPRTL